jgi:hypothetical protein
MLMVQNLELDQNVKVYVLLANEIQSLDLPNMKHACLILLSTFADLSNECNQISYMDLYGTVSQWPSNSSSGQHIVASLHNLVSNHTSARTILSMMVCNVSSNLHLCTPSNHSLRCSLAFLRDTSRLLYVFSAARFWNIPWVKQQMEVYNSVKYFKQFFMSVGCAS